MSRVDIDFAPRGVARIIFHAPRTIGVVLVLGILFAVLLVRADTHYQILLEQHDRLHERIVVASRPKPIVLPPPRKPIPAAQARAVNAAVLQLNLPWAALYDSLQEATPATVALLAVEPDARMRSVRITAEAKTSDEMISYVEQLKRQDWFVTVNLVHHEIIQQDPNHPLRFEIDAAWGSLP